jgi:hypothetical protein
VIGRLDLLTGALLVCSLALNVFLWSRAQTTVTGPPGDAALRRPPRPSRHTDGWRLPLPRLRGADPEVIRAQGARAMCGQRATALASQLDELGRLRARHATAGEVAGRPADPSAAAGSVLLQGALHDFESSGAVEGCQRQHPGRGPLDAHVTLVSAEDGDPQDEPAGVSVRTSGPLVGTPLGQCIESALHRALEALPLPPRFERILVLVQYPRP